MGAVRRCGLLAALLLCLAGAGGARLAADGGEAGEAARLKALYRRPAAMPFAADGPREVARAGLGRALFFDPRLSGGNGFACATCHDPDSGWTDRLPRAVGETGATLPRRTPTLLNLAWGERFFWDGRAASLEAQALEPVQAPDEMNQPVAALVAELAADPDYSARFAAAFPDRPAVSGETIARAIAAFERRLVSGTAPFDRWVAGDAGAIGEDAKRGFLLFNGKAGCAACHSGWAFTDHAFHDIGLPGSDPGRGKVLGLPALDHAFKTPTLRDVAIRAPYMHDGSLPTLGAVLDHYATGIVARPTLSDDLRPVALTEAERHDLLAFLETLTGEQPAGSPVGEAAPPPAAPGETVQADGGADGGAEPVRSMAEVSQRDKAFRPRRISLRVGGTLSVLNDDTRKHNVRISDPDLQVNSGIQAPGETVRIRFPRAGTFEAYCGIHPKMKLTVDVGG